jgi:hypothetical protein
MPAPSITSLSGVAGSASIRVTTDATSDLNYDSGLENDFYIVSGVDEGTAAVVSDVDGRSFDVVAQFPIMPGATLEFGGSGFIYNGDGYLNTLSPTAISFPSSDDIIVIGNLVVDNTGKVITGDISGGHDPYYSPASGVTGIVVKSGSGATLVHYQIEDVTVFDTTITITLAAGIPATTVVQVDISASSNLTNLTEDTPTGQTNIAVDNDGNMIVASTLAGTDSKCVKSGYWVEGSTLFSHNVYFNGGADSQFDIKFTSTADSSDLLLQCWNSIADNFSVSIDGGAYSTPTTPADSAALSWIRLASGLATGTHTATVRRIGNAFPDSDATFRVFGGSATFATPTVLGTLTGGVTVPSGSRAPMAGTAYIIGDGHADEGTTGNYDALAETKHSNAAWRARARGTEFILWAYNNSHQLAVFIDGVQHDVDMPSGNKFGWKSLVSGLSDAYHEIEIVDATPVPGTTDIPSFYAYSLMVSGGSSPGFDTGYSPAARTVLLTYGDSKVLEAETDGRLSYTFDIHKIKNWATIVDGITSTFMTPVVSGTTYTNAGAHATRLANIDDLPDAPDIILIDFLTNDMALSVPVGTPSTADTFAKASKDCLNHLLAEYPAAVIWIVGGIPRSTKTWADIQDYNVNGYDTAIAACDDPSRVHRVDLAPLQLAGASYNTGGTFDGDDNYVDGTHLNADGALLEANYILSIIAPTAGGLLLKKKRMLVAA